jgi:hypothetical protein
VTVRHAWHDAPLAIGWGLALLAFSLGFLTAGYSGWATGFVAWTLLAVPLLLVTNRRLRVSGRTGLPLARSGVAIWAVVLLVAVTSQAWLTFGPSSDSDSVAWVGWLLLVLGWSIFAGEVGVVGWVTYAAVTQLCGSRTKAPAA